MQSQPDNLPVIVEGSGGKSSEEKKNNLFSKARLRIVDILSEGQIEAPLVNGAKSIYFDYTPLMNDKGELNFEGVTFETRTGLPDQSHLVAGQTLETPYSVGTRIYKERGPVVRTIHDENADAVRVILNIPSLTKFDKDDGVLKKYKVQYEIWVRPFKGNWARAVYKELKGKTTAPYQIEHIVDLPEGGYPWDVKIVRLSDDETKDSKQNETWWESYTTLVRGKFTFPHTAVIGLQIDAEKFGSNLPNRTYLTRGIKINVPVNYDPNTREYTGLWNGSFKVAYSNNPAWVLYDLIINDRYGLGQFVDASKIDKWSLYKVAQYCDENVPSGLKDSAGNDLAEPRFTFNGVINTRSEAFRVLRDVSAVFRGMVYWSMGQVFAVGDMPEDPVKLVTPANVIGGRFKYSGTALKARHSVALISYNDPNDFYRPNIEAVIDDDLLAQFGWRETEVQLMGCTSRGQAVRFGRWILDTAKNETETVEYEASWDHANARPGDIISVADPRKAEVRSGGRIITSDADIITLDAAFVPEEGVSYTFSVILEDGSLVSVPIIGFPAPDQVRVNTSITDVLPNAVWMITGGDIKPRYYRVLSMSESDKHTFKITALSHDPTKYARVEQGFAIDPPTNPPENYVGPPLNLSVQEINYQEDGLTKTKLYINWSPPADASTVASYSVTANTPNGAANYGTTQVNWLEVLNVSDGLYTITVRSISASGYTSTAATYSIYIESWSTTVAPKVTNLTVTSGGPGGTPFIFASNDVSISWTNTLAGTGDGFYKDNLIQIYDKATNQLMRSELVVGTSYTYTLTNNKADSAVYGRFSTRNFVFAVQVRDTLNRQSEPALLEVNNPAPPFPDGVNATPSPGNTVITIDPDSSLWEADVLGVRLWFEPYSNSITNWNTPPNRDPDAVITTSTYNRPTTNTAETVVWASFYDGYSAPNSGNTEYDLFIPQYAVGVTDTIPPGPVTSLTLSAKTGTTATFYWAPPEDLDYATTQLWYNTLDTITGATLAGTFPGSAATISGLSTNTLYYVFARAVDTSGNFGPYTEDGVSVTTSPPAGVTVGDRGDIIVSTTVTDGDTWTIDTGVVTNAKMANMTANTIKMRNSATAGAPVDVNAAGLTAATTTVGAALLGFAADGTILKFNATDLASAPSLLDSTATAITLAAATHLNKYLRINAATAVTVTIPTLTTTEWPLGAEFHVAQAGAGQVTITTSAGYTFNVPTTYAAKTRTQYAVITVKRVTSTAWDVFGLLADA